MFVPRYAFFTKGIGVHRNELESFELALRDAGISHLNLVEVSSILPPDCEIITREQGLTMLPPGQITFCVLSRNSTAQPRQQLSASVGIARPKEHHYGYISEHHDFGLTSEESDEFTQDMSASMLASTLGIQFDPDAAWDDRRQLFQMANFMVETFAVSSVGQGYYEKGKPPKWTTVIAAAVLIL